MVYKIWRQCGRKKRYRDEHAANKYRKIFERERGRSLITTGANIATDFT